MLDQIEKGISVDIDALNEETLWELYQIVRSCRDAESTKSAGLMRKSQVLMKEGDQGTGGTMVTSGCVNSRSHTTTLAYTDISHPCVDTDHTDIRHGNFFKPSASDVSERSCDRQTFVDHSIASKLDGENISAVLGYDGRSCTFSKTDTKIVNVDNTQHPFDSSSPAVAILLTEVEYPCKEQLSPTRALRAAMLRSRFVDTILKAQHKTLLNHGEKGDPTRLQCEKEKLEKKQREVLPPYRRHHKKAHIRSPHRYQSMPLRHICRRCRNNNFQSQKKHGEKSFGSEDSKEITTNKQVCKLCEDFTSRVVQYFSANETQSDIISILHQACSHTHGFKHQCDLLVDHYAPLFFVKIATLQPELVCEKTKLCGEMVSVHLPKRDDACTVCHCVVAEVLTKLQDPDTQLEIIETLMKECGKVETFAQQCKKLVFEYGPIILANAENFLKTTDICVTTHVCKAGPSATDSLGLQTNVASA